MIHTESRERGKEFSEWLQTFWTQFYCLPQYQKHGLFMNYALLSQAATSFCEDMLRIKSYHNIEYGDRHKQAAHLFKWLSRIRPIKPHNDNNPELEDIILRANSFFALACAMSCLQCDDFTDGEIKYIIYASMYRDIHAREWSMIFYLLEKQHILPIQNQ
ncbi:MAG: hypothetical protein LBC55_01295 [Desulfovibrio sp.]|nr:hypothetical protein [Desulfovibrio sp.]